MNVRWLYSNRNLVALFVTAAVAVGLMAFLVIRQQQDQANGQVYLEAGGSVGSNPFVPSLSPPATAGVSPGAGGTPIQTGRDNRLVCDTEKLISFLSEDPQVGAAWVNALNSDRTLSWSGGSRIGAQQIPAYIRELAPRVLAEDLRVTNYQFTNGTALAVQSVLEKGSSVLVDSKGVARVRCASGNPLTPMVQQRTPPIYRGKPWPSFQPQRVVVIQRSSQCGDGEYYDGANCQQVAVCPASDYRGDDGRCYGRGNPEPPDNGRPPDVEHSDKPVRPDAPRHPDRPVRPDEPQRSDESQHLDKPARPDEPRHSDVPARPEEPKHPDRPARPGEAQRPNRSEQPDIAKHPDEEAPPHKPKDANKPVQPNTDEHLDEPKHVNKPARQERTPNQDESTKPDESEQKDKSAKPERDTQSHPADSPQ